MQGTRLPLQLSLGGRLGPRWRLCWMSRSRGGAVVSRAPKVWVFGQVWRVWMVDSSGMAAVLPMRVNVVALYSMVFMEMGVVVSELNGHSMMFIEEWYHAGELSREPCFRRLSSK